VQRTAAGEPQARRGVVATLRRWLGRLDAHETLRLTRAGFEIVVAPVYCEAETAPLVGLKLDPGMGLTRLPSFALDHTVVQLEGRGSIPTELTLEWTKSGGGGARTVWTGDEAFDAEVSVSGPALTALAVLSFEARARLREVMSVGRAALVINGDVRLRTHRPVRTLRRLEEYVEAALAVAAWMGALEPVAEGGDAASGLVERVVRNARVEPVEAVRWRMLNALEPHFSHSEGARRLLWRTAQDASPRIRLYSAERLGADGLAGAESVLADPGATAEQRRVAAELMLQWSSASEGLAYSWEWLDHGVQGVRDVAVRFLAGVEGERALARVLSERGAHDPAALSLLRSLKAATPALETHLLALLAVRHVPRGAPMAEEIAEVAARRLEEVGSRAAVAPLLARSEGAGRRLRGAIRSAVAAIQARLGDADAGRLSLASRDDGAGGLSLSEAHGGLSRVEEDGE
jgi:hypothetical protein